jgi:hypothetical protein
VLVRPRLGIGLALTALVVASTLVRSIAWWHKATPSYFPDEYLYAELSRSLADSGLPLVRGAGTGFPSLLQPVLTAPLWLFHDVALSYHLVQVLATFAMSLVVVPVYLLARRLGLGAGVGLACAAFALAVPDFLYASRILAEPFGYPIALAAVLAGTVALAGGGKRWQVVFVVLVGLAVLTRVQFMVLPVAYLAAIAVVGLRARALTRIAREQTVVLAVLGLALLASVARPGVVGQYGAFLDIGVDPRLAERLATNGFGLGYACGWLLVPGALLGAVLGVARPRSRAELAFAALATGFTLGLLAEASLWGDVDLIQERYFFYGLPLVALLFALYASRGWPHRRALALLAVGVLAIVAAVPVTFATAATMKIQSPFLFGAFRLERALESPGNGALVVALTVSALVAVMLACSRLPVNGPVIALALATAFCALASLGAAALDLEGTRQVRDRFLPAERSWIDEAGLDDVALLHAFPLTGDTYQQLFWNRSVDSLLLGPRVATPDAYRVERVSIAKDGTLLSGGEPVVRPLVIDEYGGLLELRAARAVASAPTHRLWRPVGIPRVALMAEGYYGDGWLGREGALRVWPSTSSGRVAGRLRFVVTPDERLNLRLRSPGGTRTYRLAPDRPLQVTIPVCSVGPWAATFTSDRSAWNDGRWVSTRATAPTWTPDPGACRS